MPRDRLVRAAQAWPARTPFGVARLGQLEQLRAPVGGVAAPADEPAPVEPRDRVGRGRERQPEHRRGVRDRQRPERADDAQQRVALGAYTLPLELAAHEGRHPLVDRDELQQERAAPDLFTSSYTPKTEY